MGSDYYAKDKFYCWPEWMPKAQRSGYGYDVADRRSRTDMEVGSLIRVNYDSDETTIDCTLILNAIQAQWFEKFEREMLTQGSQWFQMPIWIAGCIERHTVRFASRPKASNLIGPTHTTYTFRLDIQQRHLKLCQQLMDFMLCVSPKHIMGSSCAAQTFWLSLQCTSTIPMYLCEELIDVHYCVNTNDLKKVPDHMRNFWLDLKNIHIPTLPM